MNERNTLDIEVRREDEGRYVVSTSRNDNAYCSIGVLFASVSDACRVADVIASCAAPNHDHITRSGLELV